MTFNWQIRHFKTLAEFEAYFLMLTKPAWVNKATVHHTWKPTAKDWRGQTSMEALGRYYRGLGWSSGPHLFFAPDGIWMGTPITDIGVHAGPCNDTALGLEVVGDYDTAPWPAEIKELVIGALALFVRHAWVRLSQVVGHRDCMPGQKSCPGNAISMAAVRGWVAVDAQPVKPDRDVIGVEASITLEQWRRALLRNEAPLSRDEMDRAYTFCEWLDIDPAFVLALWVHEGGRPLGSSPLQAISKCPLNIKAAAMEWRYTVSYNGARWLAFESFQLGLFAGILHLKQYYGAFGKVTVRSIIPAFAPASDGNNVEAYISSVLEDMAYIRAH